LLNDTSGDQIELVERREAFLIGLAFLFLVLLAASLTLSTAARLGSWEAIGDRWVHWIVLPIWLMAYLLLRHGLNRVNPSRDPLLLPIPLLFIGWGLLTIWRLDQEFGIRQLGWFILASCSVYLMITFASDLRWIRRYRYLWITLGLGLMALTLFFGTHPGGGSPRLWLGCCGLYFQPSEGLRVLLVAFLAAYLADRLPFQGITQKAWDLRTWVPLLFIWLLSFGLLVVQRDLGTGMLFLALLTMLLYLVLDRWQVLVAAGLFALISGGLGYFLFDVVAVRVEAWLNPWLDPLGGSYQIAQSLITVASGGLFGRGLGMGSPGFVPAIHTDFIFTAMIEEHGLLAGLAVIALWGIWISRIFSDVRKHREPFSALLSAGLGISIGLQALLIIGGNLRLFPLVGVTLPFTSYGGSSLLISCISLGILLLLSNGESTSDRFQAPLRRLHAGMLLGWGAIALILGWWTLIRAPALTARGDNPRWAVDSRYSKRGDILDRNGEVLARTMGSIGSYERVYPSPQAATIVGYNLFPYGQTGIEGSQDEILRGLDRRDPWHVAWSYLTRGVSPVGSDVRLTLNQKLQAQAMDLLDQQRGAIVLIDADSGELLSAASYPSYDPNNLAQAWSTLVADPGAPLLNRAVQGQYQPGTALAPFILAWAVDNEMVVMDLPVTNMGQAVPINGDELTCAIPAEPVTHLTLRDALAHGCPSPIQQVLLELGGDAYAAVLSSFGFDQPAGPDIEAAIGIGSMPETLDALGLAAIGQHELTLSPLQLARALAALISEGELPTIGMVDAVRSEGLEWERFKDGLASVSILSSGTATQIRSALSVDQTFKYSAKAIAGEPLGWFLGGVRSLGGNFAVVVVLENGSTGEAANIGEMLLRAAQTSALP
jgi:cell division protein FtsW (lipid II flippase)/cell division protein FtsI/penicillin-binding protein 2